MEDVGLFYGRLVYFTSIWFILWPCGIVYGNYRDIYIYPFWYVVPRKIRQPW
jgi:hypothetical protein